MQAASMWNTCARSMRLPLGAILLMAICLSTPAAPSFSSLYVLGDSLSDTDANPFGGNYASGRWSNGPLWPETLSTLLSLGYATSKNVAMEGADSHDINSQRMVLVIAGDASTALFVQWIGGNDFLNAADPGETQNDAFWDNLVAVTVQNITNNLAQLYNMGGRHFLIPNLPDMGKVPEILNGHSSGYASYIGSKSVLFNMALKKALAALRVNYPSIKIYEADVYARMNEIIANPAGAGFTVTSIGAITDPDLADKSLTGPGANYLFWDYIHPTTKTHSLTAQWFLDVLSEPAPLPILPWRLDPSFGVGGVSITRFGGDDYGNSLALQADGKIVVAGSSQNSGDYDFALVRYTASGELDTGFGTNGRVTTDIGSGNDWSSSVALQSDGKIILIGNAFNGSNYDFAVVRYTATGELDASFGTGGKVTTPVGLDAGGNSVVLQSDGKILVAGSAFNGSNSDFAVVRYTVTGELDVGFGTGGKVITPFGMDAFGISVAIQPDGKILVAGGAFNGNNNDFALVRYTTSGELDATFGTGGKLTTVLGSGGDFGFSIALQSDGKILVTGSAFNGSYDDFALVRYTASGELDTDFGLTGKIITPIRVNTSDRSVAVQADAKIVVAGTGDDGNFALARYTSSGELDADFGTGGKLVASSGLNGFASGMALRTDGQVVIAGTTYNGSNNDFALARVEGGGTFTPASPSILLQPESINTSPGQTVTFSATAIGAPNPNLRWQRSTDGGGNWLDLTDTGSVSGSGTITLKLSNVQMSQNGHQFRLKADNGFNPAAFSQPAVLTVGAPLVGTLLTSGVPVTGLSAGKAEAHFFRIVVPSGHNALNVSIADGSGDADLYVRYNSPPTLDGWSYRPYLAGNIETAAVSFASSGEWHIMVRGFAAYAGVTLVATSGARPAITDQSGDVTVKAGQTATFSAVATGEPAPTMRWQQSTDGGANWADLVDGGNVQGTGTGTLTLLNTQTSQSGRLFRLRAFNGLTPDALSAVAMLTVHPVGLGALDVHFGNTGKMTFSLSSNHDEGRGIALQPDGKILVTGSRFNGSNDDFALLRFLSNGEPDVSFGVFGMVTTSVGSGNDHGYSVALQDDGKILVAGYARVGSNDDFALVRYLPDGSLDPEFGSGGVVTTAVGSGTDQGFSVAVQADGKIVVAGSSSGFAMVRYLNDGALDDTFGTGGKVITTIGSSSRARSVVIQNDGKIVLGGESFNGSNLDFALARYNASGSLDTGFGGIGKVITSFGSGNDFATSLALQSDGKIILAGSAFVGGRSTFGLARYTTAGELDFLFGTGGKVSTAIGTSSGANNIAIQDDDLIVAVGTATIAGNNDFALARYTATGRLDASFGTEGLVTTPVGVSDELAYDLAIQDDGRLLVVGSVYIGGLKDIALVRYLSGGADPYVAAAITQQPLNQTVTAGDVASFTCAVSGEPSPIVRWQESTDGGANWLDLDDFPGIAGSRTTTLTVTYARVSQSGSLFRLNAYNGIGSDVFSLPATLIVNPGNEGPLDVMFGVGGKAITSMGLEALGMSLAVQSDGKIIVSGQAHNGSNFDFALVRYTTGGELDASFGTGGKVTTGLGSGEDWGNSVALQTDGKIIVAGRSFYGSNDDFALARYTTTGELDASFGNGGKVTTPVGNNSSGSGVAVQTDDKIVVAGSAFNGTSFDFAVVRYTTTGELDTSFGTSGTVITPVGLDASANSVALQADGRIVVAGQANTENGPSFAVVRYMTDGELDTSFGVGGRVITPMGVFSYGYSVKIQPDGKIVVGGTTFTGNNNQFGLIRYTPFGELDLGFGTGGKVITPLGLDAAAYSVALQADGRIVVAGSASTGDNQAFALARYTPSGDLDTSFGTGGKVITLVGLNAFGQSVAILANGNIAVAGAAHNGTHNDFALLRYEGMPAQPALTITLSAGILRLSWPSQFTGFSLEKSNTLAPTSWLSVEPLPTVMDGEHVVTTPATGDFGVFRLRQVPPE